MDAAPRAARDIAADVERRRENSALLRAKWDELALLEEKEYLAKRAALGPDAEGRVSVLTLKPEALTARLARKLA